MSDFEYSGSELDVFVHATNWKSYWASIVGPFFGETILDVGAGVGATARNFRSRNHRRWLELEPDAQLADRIRASIRQGSLPASIEVRNGTSRSLAQDDKFDTILYIDVLEHIADDAIELAKVSRHLSPGGRIIILAPAHNWLYTPFDRQIGHFRRYSKATLLATKPAALSLECLRYVDSVGLLASLANRLLLKTAAPTFRQVQIWDSLMIPASRVADRILAGSVGKSIIAVFRNQ